MKNLNDELFDSIEKLLDYYAVEYYGEFGYDTLDVEQQKKVRQLVIEELYK